MFQRDIEREKRIFGDYYSVNANFDGKTSLIILEDDNGNIFTRVEETISLTEDQVKQAIKERRRDSIRNQLEYSFASGGVDISKNSSAIVEDWLALPIYKNWDDIELSPDEPEFYGLINGKVVDIQNVPEKPYHYKHTKIVYLSYEEAEQAVRRHYKNVILDDLARSMLRKEKPPEVVSFVDKWFDKLASPALVVR